MAAAIPTELYPTLQRKVAFDALPCEEIARYMPTLGVVPASAEGAALEHADSHARLGLQEPLQPVVSVMALMTGRALAALALQLKDSPEPDEIVAMVSAQFGQTIHIGTSVILANLLEEGYIQLTPKALSDV